MANISSNNKMPETKPKKPFYHRWWFIVLCLFFAFGLGASSGQKNSTNDNNTSQSVSTISTELTDNISNTRQNATGAEVGYFIFGFFICLIPLVVIGVNYFKLRKRYIPIDDIDKTLHAKKFEYKNLSVLMLKMEQDIKIKTASIEDLQKALAVFEDDLDTIEFGVYKPRHDFDTSERYKLELDKLYERQKALVKDGGAAICHTPWQVNGSRKEGEKQSRDYMKLMLQAFNGECEAAVSKVTWNNVNKMEMRIKKVFEMINKLGRSHTSEITYDYLHLMLKELYLTFEYEERKYKEREEQRAIREQMKEEERAQREFERAIKDAEDEEKRYEKALEKAREELSSAEGAKSILLQEKIAELERQLKEAEEIRQRAISQAQLTKSGYVYIISNIGSFGEHVYKIGMTRRLDPMDRVKELGDASVPFEFDVHGMIYTENAPDVENSLHKAFENRRLNLVNLRKEFFNVSLDDIEELVAKRFPDAELTKTAAAKEYRESMAIRKEKVS